MGELAPRTSGPAMPRSSVWSPQEITSTPVAERPKSWQNTARLISFVTVFVTCQISLHIVQLFTLLLALHPALGSYYERALKIMKASYGQLLACVVEIFGPTKVILTVGKSIDVADVVRTGATGVTTLVLPGQSVIMANHQVYNDWLYIWTILYLADLHSSLYIILKASLKWLPIVGPAMQMFRLIFLGRSWQDNRRTLEKSLAQMSARTQMNGDPFSLLIFPEGTLLSPLTKPKSQAFANKMGIDDANYTLLPRSTGILYCLRALAADVPNLRLVDLTIGYEGVKPWPQGFGQQYYTLQSTFGHGQSPPAIHVHMDSIPLKSIPIGSVPERAIAGEHPPAPTDDERDIFDRWLLDRWRVKDELLGQFYASGRFTLDESTARTIPLRFDRRRDRTRLLVLLVPGLLMFAEVIRSFIAQLILAM